MLKQHKTLIIVIKVIRTVIKIVFFLNFKFDMIKLVINMEIEKKFLVKKMPDLSLYEYKEISQGYLNENDPVLRIRKFDNDYYLTYKFNKGKNKDINVALEYELEITKEAFEHLKTKTDGKMINKRRYFIPLNDGLTCELDVFDDGLVLAEVEFKNEEDAIKFVKPDWFLEDVTFDEKYRNSYMTLKKSKKY